MNIDTRGKNNSGSNNNTTYAVVLIALIVAWASLQWTMGRQDDIAGDWMGWRQSDTQSIALNFLSNGHDLLKPQINWGGAGPGYVESELQLFPWLESWVLRLTGDREWPGQLMALVFMALSGFVLFLTVSLFYSGFSSALACLVYFNSIGTLHLATSIQPDSLSFLMYVTQLYCFLRFIVGEHNKWLWAACVFSILAILVKPPALQLGLFQFLAVLLIKPRLLKLPKLWFFWLLILAVFAGFVFHAHSLYVQYGNTFGIGFGGDSKYPTINTLIDPTILYRTARISMGWGISNVGMLALCLLIVGRRLRGIEFALMVANAAMLLIALRYSSSLWYGSHYHIFTIVLGVWATAHCVEWGLERGSGLSWFKKSAVPIVFSCCVILFCISVYSNTVSRNNHGDVAQGEKFIELGLALKAINQQGDKVVVRSPVSSRVEPEWGGGPNNFQDPRLFYVARAQGWSIASEDESYEAINQFAKLGAKYYVHPASLKISDTFRSWLESNTKKRKEVTAGTIYELINYESLEFEPPDLAPPDFKPSDFEPTRSV